MQTTAADARSSLVVALCAFGAGVGAGAGASEPAWWSVSAALLVVAGWVVWRVSGAARPAGGTDALSAVTAG